MRTRAIVSIMFNLLMIGFIMSLSVYSYSASYSKVQAQQVEVAQATTSTNLVDMVKDNGLYLATVNYLQQQLV